MCTASWLIRPDGFALFFNRDESRRRGAGLAPRLLELDGVRALAPQDSDAGGTWIGVNEHGLALGLLNAWDARTGPEGAAPPREPRSRGLLVRGLLSARDASEALERLGSAPLERYPGFTLALFEPGREPLVRAWDGVALSARAPRAPRAPRRPTRARAARARARRARA